MTGYGVTDSLQSERFRWATHRGQFQRIIGFLIGRAVYFAVVVLVVYTLAFVLLYALPGDPVELMLQRRSMGAGGTTAEQIAGLRAHYGLDHPLAYRYFSTLGQLLSGDLGVSFQSGKPVGDVIGAVLPNTLRLAGAALLISIPGATGLALLTSWRTESRTHRILVQIPAAISAIPAFWLGLVLLQLFAYQLRWLPAGGDTGVLGLVLPAIALGLPVTAVLAAVLVRSLDGFAEAEFIGMLRARGLPWRHIYLTHVARNSLLPFMTMVGLTIGGVLVGTVVTETVFARSGLGRVLVSAVESQDTPMVLAIAMLAAILFAALNLAVNLTYPLLDARLRGPGRGVRP